MISGQKKTQLLLSDIQSACKLSILAISNKVRGAKQYLMIGRDSAGTYICDLKSPFFT